MDTKRILFNKILLVFTPLVFYSFFIFAQKELKPSHKIAFVIFENRYTNFILIPNLGKLHSFKIYRKQKNEVDFKFIDEIKKPILPIRNECGPGYAVCWEDPKYRSRDVDYKIVAFNKKGVEICEMIIILEKENEVIDNADSLK